MKAVLALLVLLPLVHSQKAQCCYPQQYQARVDLTELYCSDKGGSTYLSIEIDRLEIDWKKKQLREDIGFGSLNWTILVFYNDNIGYFYTGKICTKFKPSPIPTFLVGCTPEKVHVSPLGRLGYQPSINVASYSWDTTSLTFTESCSPVSGQFYFADNEGKGLLSFMLKNLTPAINPSDFDVPDICKNATTDDTLPSRVTGSAILHFQKHQEAHFFQRI